MHAIIVSFLFPISLSMNSYVLAHALLLNFSQACASLEPNYQPPVTFVVVQKRHHTRLFANNHNDRNAVDRSGNILPGEEFDLVSMGTS